MAETHDSRTAVERQVEEKLDRLKSLDPRAAVKDRMAVGGGHALHTMREIAIQAAGTVLGGLVLAGLVVASGALGTDSMIRNSVVLFVVVMVVFGAPVMFVTVLLSFRFVVRRLQVETGEHERQVRDTEEQLKTVRAQQDASRARELAKLRAAQRGARIMDEVRDQRG